MATMKQVGKLVGIRLKINLKEILKKEFLFFFVYGIIIVSYFN